MSLNVLTQGGGTGGASASIFVRGLSEADTVTATKNGKTVKGKWGTKTIEVPYAIPVMTSDTTPSGKVSASSSFYTSPAYQAFDGEATSKAWLPDAGSVASESYLQYEFPNLVSIGKVNLSVKADYASAYSSVNYDWVIQASEDGQVWENITEAQNTTAGMHEYELASLDMRFFKFIRFQITGSSTGYAHVANQYSAQVYSFQVDAVEQKNVDGHTITIKDYGMWTVTATNGEKTSTQDVLVDVAMGYEIEMDLYKLWLYREGDEREDTTGGWAGGMFISDYGVNKIGSFTKGAASLQMSTSSNVSAGFFTSNKIDITEYSMLVVNVTEAVLPADFTINSTTQILVDRTTGGARYSADVGDVTIGECRFPMTDFQGGYYIGFGCWRAGGKLVVDKVWLE